MTTRGPDAEEGDAGSHCNPKSNAMMASAEEMGSDAGQNGAVKGGGGSWC